MTPRKTPRTILVLACSALLVPALTARAQEKPKDPGDPGITPPKSAGDGGKRPGGRIRMGDVPGESEGPAAPAPAPEAPKPAKSDVETWAELLSKWPAPEAKQASIRLSTQAAAATPLLLRRLEASAEDWRAACGAAATLGKIGDLKTVDALVAKLQDRRMFLHSAELLDAIVRIDPAGAKSRLLGQLLHPAQAVVDEAASRLTTRVGPTDADALRDVLEAGGPAARAAAVNLLTHADRAAARTSLGAALRDPAPDVALAAARGLASDDAPEAEDVLRRCTTTQIDRQLAYASVGLALRAERTGRRTIDETLAKLLLGGRGLSGVDPLSRAAAAVALADLGYFHEVPSLDEALDRKIVPELIDVVAGRTFWADLRVFQPLAVRRLQRLTGRSTGTLANEWSAWWQQASSSFRARRVLLEIPAEAATTLSVTIRGPKAPGGEGTTFAASPEGLAWAAPDEFPVLLDEAAARELAGIVNLSGLLHTGESSAGVSEGIAPIEAVVRAGKRERRLAFPESASSPGLRDLLQAATDLRRRFRWQRYRTQTQALDLPSFVGLVGSKFGAERSDAERDAALADLITNAVDDQRGTAWNIRALEELRSISDLGTALGDEGTLRLVRRLGQREQSDPVGEAIVLTLAKARRAEAHPLLLDFLLTRPSVRSQELLVAVFRDAAPASLRAGLADERAPVRAAACAALADQLPREEAEASVRKALNDGDLLVRRESVRALGRLQFEWARGDLESLASKPGELRGAAVEALGRLGGKQALPALMSAFASDDPGLRIAAVEALGATREPEAISAIAFAMSMDPAAMVREVASRVLVGLGTDRAAAELRRLALDRGQPAGPRTRAIGGLVLLSGRESARDLARLVEDPADEVADAAALALADWRDASSVPRLLRMLEQGRQPRVVRNALEGVSLESFTQDDAQLVASLYAGWWETSRDRGPRGWLVDALVLAGIDDPGLRAWETGTDASGAVPSLLKGLRAESWAVRRASDLALRDVAQRSFGDVGQFSTPSELARIAAAWEDWWASRAPADTSR